MPGGFNNQPERRVSSRSTKGQTLSTPYAKETFPTTKHSNRHGQDQGEAAYALMVETVHASEPNEPATLEEAMDSVNKSSWLAAMRSEIEELERLGTFEFPTLQDMENVPGDQQILGSRWVFKIKADGRYRARLVAKGYAQQYGIHYFDTTAPVARHESLRTLLSIAATTNACITQVDVKAAFPNSPLDIPILMKLPKFRKDNKDAIVLLKKALYGLKQSGRAWYKFLLDILISLDFERSEADECVFIHKERKVTVLVYVDDLLVFSQNKEDAEFLLIALQQKVEITITHGTPDPSNSTLRFRFLGMQLSLTKSLENGTQIRLDQAQYVDSILSRFNMQDCKPTATPAVPKHRLAPRSIVDASSFDSSTYQSAVGSLM